MGVGDQNIQAIQENIDAQIVVRGNTIHLDGKKGEIAMIESVVDEMMLTINQKTGKKPNLMSKLSPIRLWMI